MSTLLSPPSPAPAAALEAHFAPMTPERLDAVLDALAAGQQPKTGTQEPGRHTSEPANALSSLKEMVTENHDYRSEW